MKTVGILLIIGSVQVFSVLADDSSARRYASLQADPVNCKYFLLSEKTVQENLSLTQSQKTSLQSALLSSPTNIPAIVELRHAQQQLLKAAYSDEERAGIRRSGNEKASFLIHENWGATLRSTLSSAQTKRLDELFLQMKGPHSILEDTNIVLKLNLTKDQISQLNDVSNSDQQFLSLLRQRFLGLQIQPMRKRERADLDSEVENLFRVIREVEKDQDAGLLAVLTEDQRRLWKSLCGASVQIDWKVEYFSDMPFQEEGKRE